MVEPSRGEEVQRVELPGCTPVPRLVAGNLGSIEAGGLTTFCEAEDTNDKPEARVFTFAR